MDLEMFYNSDMFKWVILPILIFCARLIDVSLGTVRIIFISRGLKYIAPLIAFVEINIWLLAIGQIIVNINNIVCAVAYAAGFAMGNFIGILIEEKISIGLVIVRIITKHDAEKLIDCLIAANYGVTTVDADGVNGKVKLIFAIIRRGDLHTIIDSINRIHPHAFYSVEDVRSASDAIIPATKHGLLRLVRKGK